MRKLGSILVRVMLIGALVMFIASWVANSCSACN